jgi:hypothetical protein
MSASARRAELGTHYLLGHRGPALRALCPDPGPELSPILDGLCDEDRQVRAQALSRVVHEMVSELAARELAASCEGSR